ncbi:MFS transporter [Microbacterium sorbitolivorans]|uniref:MFS transporter n=1 Tax=Microbacterium sorbitolivorans TaxID=1867410 RepID=A0A367XYG6_9MICO|nr:MFS transporter [Microbacterium sorbitolivorans]RCK58634.1 MFS transporter [Microbacterium sorbitolivorans]GGF38097.1 MFS transporter [Microbacterium sorbitolivorans]
MTSATRILWVAILASFVSFLDGTIVNVALPAIDRELGGGLATQQWVVDGYLVTLGALMLVAGSVSDTFGRALVLRIGLVGFGIASVAIALAPDPGILIAARLVQGAAGAFLVPSSLALITSAFDGPAQSKAIGTWTSFTTGAMIAGPLIGGALVDLASWRLAFLINVVPIAATLVLARGIRDPQRSAGARIDALGAAMCVLGLGGVVFALIEQPRRGWADPAIAIAAIGGVALFALFLARQHTARSPILPLALFRIRNFWAGNLATAFIYAALSLNGFVLAIYLQQGAGLSATLAGLASLPVTILMILLSSRAGELAGRWGARWFMTLGPLLMAAGSVMLLLVGPDFDYWWQVLPGMIVFGIGLTTTVSPLTSTILGSIDAERSGIASAVNNAISRVAGLIAVAMIGTAIGGSLDLAGFHRACIIVAALLAAGGLVSWVGIRDRRAPRARMDP